MEAYSESNPPFSGSSHKRTYTETFESIQNNNDLQFMPSDPNLFSNEPTDWSVHTVQTGISDEPPSNPVGELFPYDPSEIVPNLHEIDKIKWDEVFRGYQGEVVSSGTVNSAPLSQIQTLPDPNLNERVATPPMENTNLGKDLKEEVQESKNSPTNEGSTSGAEFNKFNAPESYLKKEKLLEFIKTKTAKGTLGKEYSHLFHYIVNHWELWFGLPYRNTGQRYLIKTDKIYIFYRLPANFTAKKEPILKIYFQIGVGEWKFIVAESIPCHVHKEKKESKAAKIDASHTLYTTSFSLGPLVTEKNILGIQGTILFMLCDGENDPDPWRLVSHPFIFATHNTQDLSRFPVMKD